MTNHKLTEQQERALEVFRGESDDLLLEAAAGAGKTSTLVECARQAAGAGREGVYMAFNRALVNDAKGKFPGNVSVSTIHSLAHTQVIKRTRPDLQRRIGGKRLPRREEAQILGVNAQFVDNTPVGPKRLAAGFLAGYVLDGVNRWCQTDDPEPAAKHLPTIDVLDPAGAFGHRGPNNWALAEQHVPYMRKAWAEITREGGRLRFEHGHYLKMWEQSSPTIPADFILLDEAQDVAPVVRSVFLQQQARGTHLVMVGDANQAIYGFTGAVNAMDHLRSTAVTAQLTKSFRFGEPIAAAANAVLAMIPENEMTVEGFERIESTVGSVDDPDCILTRTNALAVTRALELMRAGRKVAIAKALRDTVVSFARASVDLANSGWTSHRELNPFSSWGEVREFVQQDVAGSELGLMVRLVDEFGADTIIGELDQTVTEGAADVTISTAHTGKGREWGTVQLARDFPQAAAETGLAPQLSVDEARLLYVAVTRARNALDLSQVGWLNSRLQS